MIEKSRIKYAMNAKLMDDQPEEVQKESIVELHFTSRICLS